MVHTLPHISSRQQALLLSPHSLNFSNGRPAAPIHQFTYFRGLPYGAIMVLLDAVQRLGLVHSV